MVKRGACAEKGVHRNAKGLVGENANNNMDERWGPRACRPTNAQQGEWAADRGPFHSLPRGQREKRGVRGGRASRVGAGQTKKAQYGRGRTWSFCFPSGAQASLAWPKNKRPDPDGLSLFGLRSEADSNRCSSFCRAVPSHSAIRPFCWAANLKDFLII